MVSSAPDLTTRILRHERALVIASVLALVGLSWLYLARSAHAGGSSMPMAVMREPSIIALIIMWWLMMVAMMLPSAAPAILLYSRVRAARSDSPLIAQTWIFLAGYLAVWLLFSLGAASAQRLLTGPSMSLDSRTAQACVLIAAGIYQLSPFKTACVRQCRSPTEFLSRYWRPGTQGAAALGMRHGIYCLGCCWMMMTLLFVGGVMNLIWIVLLTLLVAGEKLLPRGELLARASGVALIFWGIDRLVA